MAMSFKTLQYVSTGLVTLGTILGGAAIANAITLKVTVENLAPTNGQAITPLWYSFHDGSFDLFDVGSPAPRYLELLAEIGVVGDPGGRIPPDFFADAAAAGLDVGALLALLPDTVSAAFATSPAALNGGVQDSVFTDFLRVNPFFGTLPPGTTASSQTTFNADPINNRFFSYGAMVLLSNDGFIANEDPTAIPIFNASGKFIGADFIVFGNQVWDAGTEVNDEDPLNVPFQLTNFESGVAENGTVQLHPGLLPPGSGGIVDFNFNGFTFENADFSVPPYRIARITIEQVPEPSSILGLLGLGITGLIALITKKT